MRYPSIEVISCFTTIYNFVASVLPRVIDTRMITRGIMKCLIPHVLPCGILCPRHRKPSLRAIHHTTKTKPSLDLKYVIRFWKHFLGKFVSPLVKNYCQIRNESLGNTNIVNKPRCRKILKVESNK